MRQFFIQSLLFISALLLCHGVYGGLEPTHSSIRTPDSGTPPVYVSSPEAHTQVQMASALGGLPHTDRMLQSVVTFGVNHHYPAFHSAMSVTIQVKVDYFATVGSSTPYLTEMLSMALSYKPGDSLTFRDKQSITLSGSPQKYALTITEVIVNGGWTGQLPSNLYLDADMYVDRYYDFSGTCNNPVSIYPIGSNQLVDSDCDEQMDELVISWSGQNTAASYQLEWVYINDEKEDGSFYSASELRYDFKHNSTRVSTTSRSYKISLAGYGRGYICYRVRGIGVIPPDYQTPVFGVWSKPEQGLVSTVDRYAKTYSWNEDMNWQYSATYAEEGKKKEVVSFFDGTLRNRQTVTKINSDKNTIVGETIYDHHGRPAVQVLPTPVLDVDCSDPAKAASLNYYPNFTQNTSGAGYSRTDFDTSPEEEPCGIEAGGMGTESGASRYYSPENPMQSAEQGFVPDAKKYPFSQVEYTPDNTGRIRRQGGVGEEFQLGSGHESKFYYGHPSQIELDRMFGSEVGDKAHYQKNMVIDPNGQVSVSYLDQEGRTIATSLAGDPPVQYQLLPSGNTPPEVMHENLLGTDAAGKSVSNALVSDGTEKLLRETILISSPTDVIFDYDVSPTSFTDGCLAEGICFSCVYDLTIRVYDECGVDRVAASSTAPPTRAGKFVTGPGGEITFSTDCSAYDFPAQQFTLPLEIGSYQVVKSLKINEQARDFYVKTYLDSLKNTCIRTQHEFNQEALANANFVDCDPDTSCAQCITRLGTLDFFLAQGGTAQGYQQAQQRCNAMCEDISPCEASKFMMLNDMAPGGQYGQYITATGATDPTQYPLSIYNHGNVLPCSNGTGPQVDWHNPLILAGTSSIHEYRDEDGSRSRVSVTVTLNSSGNIATVAPAVVSTGQVLEDPATGTYYTYPENLQSVDDFVSAWQLSWANSLLSYHPEYYFYKTCLEFGTKVEAADNYTSEAFDSLLRVTDTWNGAIAAGLIKANYLSFSNVNDRLTDWFSPSATNAWDPFVAHLLAFDNAGAELENRFAHYQTLGGNRSMAEVAAVSARCPNVMGAVPSASCFRFGDNVGSDPAVNTDTRNHEWQVLRSFYLSVKQQLQQELSVERSVNHSSYYGYNGCIGNESFNPLEHGFFQAIFPLTNSQYFNPDQPCNSVTAAAYRYKVRRFAASESMVDADPDAVAYQQYLLTGKCPVPAKLEQLLSEIAADGLLTDEYGFSSEERPLLNDLMLAANNYYLDHLALYNWQAIVGDTYISVFIYDDADHRVGQVGIVLPTGADFTLDDIIGFTSILPNYEITAILADGRHVNVTLSSSFNLSNCHFEEVCTPNQLAGDLSILMEALAGAGKLDDPAVQLKGGSSVYAPLVTLPIQQAAFGGPATTLFWDYHPASKTFRVYKSNINDIRLELKINATEPAGFNLANLNLVGGITRVVPTQSNTFDIVCEGASGNYLVTLKCQAIRNDLTHSELTGVSMGNCALPTSALCKGQEFANASELEALFRDVILNQQTTGSGYNLFASSAMTPNLQAQLSATTTTSTTQNLGGIPGAPDHWEVTRIDSLFSTCDITFTISDKGIPALHLNEVTSLGNAVPYGPLDAHGNRSAFYFPATFNTSRGIIADTIFIETCLPLKLCKSCLDDFPVFEPDTLLPIQQQFSLKTAQKEPLSEDYTGYQAAPVSDPCAIAYNDYTGCITRYNIWAMEEQQDSVFSYDFATFKAYQGCNCVDLYCSKLTDFMSGISQQNPRYIDIISICSESTQPPCTPDTPLHTDVTFPTLPFSDPCADFARSVAYANAFNAYNNYIDSITQLIGRKYTEHCMNAAETFTRAYIDREYHRTLYYYDQAGNLIKTIPPEGVEVLPITSNTDELEVDICKDRLNGTHKILTNHRLETRYEYNSLNQLVAQSVPDQDKMDIWDITLPNGLYAGLNTTAIQMVSSTRGYLSGSITLSSGIVRGFLYRTDNGGTNWTKVNNTVAAKISSIAMATPTVGFAVGDNGVALHTIDGGTTWDMLNLYSGGLNFKGILTDVICTSATAARFVGEGARVINIAISGTTTTPSVATVTVPAPLTSTHSFIGFRAIEFDGTDYYYAAVLYANSGGGSDRFDAILRGTNLAALTIENIAGARNTAIAAFGPTSSIVMGKDGNLVNIYTPAGNVTTGFKQRLQTSSITNTPISIFFITETRGIGLFADVSSTKAYYTLNGGTDWSVIPELAGMKALSLVSQTSSELRLMAVGADGATKSLYWKPSLSPLPDVFEHTANTPPQPLNLQALAVINNGSQREVVAGSSDGKLYVSNNMATGTETANYSLITQLNPSNPSERAIKIVLHRFSSGAVSGVVVSSASKLYIIYRNAGATTFGISPINSSGVTNPDFRDAVLEVTNTNVFMFDNTQKKVHRIHLNEFSHSLNTSVSTVAAPTAFISAAIGINSGRLTLVGENGLIATSNDITGSNVTAWTQRNNLEMTPINQLLSLSSSTLMAIGDNGVVLYSSGDGIWDTKTVGTTENLYGIAEFGSMQLVVGSHGYATSIDPVSSPIPLISTAGASISALLPNSDLRAVAVSGTNTYIAGTNGTVLFSPNPGTTAFSSTTGAYNTDFYAIAIPGGQSGIPKAIIGGTNAMLYKFLETTGTQQKGVFSKAIHDVHFADLNTGTLVGKDFFVRKTTDGGQSWKIVMPFYSDIATHLSANITSVWTQPNGLAILGGTNYLASVPLLDPELKSGVSGATVNDIKFHPNDPLKGYMALSNGTIKSITITNTLTVADFATPLSGINLKAIHLFEKQAGQQPTLMAVGSNNTVKYWNGAAWANFNPSPSITPSSTTFNDVFFHDDVVGYMVADNGIILRTQSTTFDPLTHVISAINYQTPTQSVLDQIVTAPNQVNIKCIAFASRYQGIWGGNYTSTISASQQQHTAYVRKIYDGSGEITSRFFYDRLGRIVVSQNSRQYAATPKEYSYTLYDPLGRVIEAGVKLENGPDYPKFAGIFGTTVGGAFIATVIDDHKLDNWLSATAGSTRKEITHSYYDRTYFTGLPASFTPDELTQRKRIVHITYRENYGSVPSEYDHATHYDYDIHGNVKTLIQDNRKMALLDVNIADQRFKRMDYNYDLISGNVHRVSFQTGKPDQWHHAYTYDADNRIREAYTTTTTPLLDPTYGQSALQNEPGMTPFWDKEVAYTYYDHGPLARTELGQQKVQGLDHTYTLQGWIKGINSNALNTAYDPGKDGNAGSNNSLTAQDAYGLSLDYFNGDYTSITANANVFATIAPGNIIDANYIPLYNGNIHRLTTTLTDPETRAKLPAVHVNFYDQLNRLSVSGAFDDFDFENNAWGADVINPFYLNTFSYDANGNILTQGNYDEGQEYDLLSYNYHTDANGKLLQNRLYHVDDDVTSNVRNNDIDDQGTFISGGTINTANNYSYDKEGRLIKDVQEQIANIVYRVDGKVKEIRRMPGNRKNLKFDYDAMGNRIAKHILSNSNALEHSTYYILDASGNVMSVYERGINEATQSVSYAQTERHIYGSKRLGVLEHTTELLSVPVLPENRPDLSSIQTTPSICVSNGKWYYELPYTTGTASAGVATFTDPNSYGAISTQIAADVIPGETYTVEFDLVGTTNLSSLSYEVRNCVGAIYANPASNTPGHYQTTFTVPVSAPAKIRIKWLGFAAVGGTDIGLSLKNIVIDGPGIQFIHPAPPPPPDPNVLGHIIGERHYELVNHLGNVNTVISDKPIPVENVGNQVITPTITGANLDFSNGVISRIYTGVGSWGDAGGSSLETLSDGDYFEWTLGGNSPEDNQYVMCGLSYSNPDHDYTTINYAWYMYFGETGIFESGVAPYGGGIGFYAVGDVFKLERSAGMINYYHNGTLKRSVSDAQPATPMIIDFAIFQDFRGIYDLKIVHTTPTIITYLPDIRQATDYSPFGVQLQGRNFTLNGTTDGRYGFQGQEEDNEIRGNGNGVNFEYRMYDPRKGRFDILDPLSADFPHNSPYAFSENNVVNAIELEGLEKVYVYAWNAKTETWVKKYTATDVTADVNRNKYVVFDNTGKVKSITYQTVKDKTYEAKARVERANEWQKDLVTWNAEYNKKIWESATPEQQKESEAIQDALQPLRDYAIEQVKPVAELYTIQATLGGSGFGTLTRSAATATAAEEVTVVINRGKYPEAAAHIEEAQAAGYPSTLTLNRSGATANRKEALRGIKTKTGLDRDEYPPAVFQEGGRGSSVKYIPPSDNRGSGASLGRQLKGVSDGAKVKIKTE